MVSVAFELCAEALLEGNYKKVRNTVYWMRCVRHKMRRCWAGQPSAGTKNDPPWIGKIL